MSARRLREYDDDAIGSLVVFAIAVAATGWALFLAIAVLVLVLR